LTSGGEGNPYPLGVGILLTSPVIGVHDKSGKVRLGLRKLRFILRCYHNVNPFPQASAKYFLIEGFRSEKKST